MTRPAGRLIRPARAGAAQVIVERESELDALALAAREALAGEGSIVLIEGEAGIGKSILVDAIRSVLPAEGRLLLGWCDDLATPRVLGAAAGSARSGRRGARRGAGRR